MPKKRTQKEKLGWRRVASWVHTVINPITDGLEIERSRLDKGDITWNYFTKRCEYIRPISWHIDISYPHNYDDFLKANQSIKSEFEAHDKALSELEEEADRTFTELTTRHEKFKQGVIDFVENAQNLVPQNGNKFTEIFNSIAGNIINNKEEMPTDYVYSDFWNKYRDHLKGKANIPVDREIDLVNLLSKLELCREELKKITISLYNQLVELRTELCEQYDIPADPSPYPNVSAER